MNTAAAPGLHYPWEAPPALGETTEVAAGLHWLRLPLPFRLDHINVWLLDGPEGWTAIDTGCDTTEIRAAWEGSLSGLMQGAPLEQLIATHGHVDHIGLAGWLTERFGSRYHASFGEWLWSRLSHLRDVPGSEPTLLHFLNRHGVPGEIARSVAEGRKGFMDMATDVPGSIRELRNGSRINFGGRDWQVIVTRGHTYEHAAFWCEEDGILIVGDHLLPHISPVVAVFEMVPEADPLGDYLASFNQFAEIPDDALVLPSHGRPYRGLHRRIAELRAHHRERLDAFEVLLDREQTSYELSRRLFAHVKGDDEMAFALGETLAHLNHLTTLGRARRSEDAKGRARFLATDLR